MLRVLFILVIVLVAGFFFLSGRLKADNNEKPIFLRTDTIADEHVTNIRTNVHAIFEPSPAELTALEKDYSNIWAHLNYLFATNNVNAGKEYYTEGWFKQLCSHYETPQLPIVNRVDMQHELHLQNWDRDGLLCSAIDSNVVFKYQYPGKWIKMTKANIAIVLLLQGDHWRVDAIRIIDEKVLPGAVEEK